jgi:CBS domain-containing protein
MKVQQAMTGKPEYVPTTMTLRDAAKRMRELDCGFLPIGDSPKGKLKGVVTDRDIAIRGVADGLDPASTTVQGIKSDKVLYCYQDDDIEAAARSMGEQKVYRLVVLDDAKAKKLCGVISLGDIARHDSKLAGRVAEGIVAAG